MAPAAAAAQTFASLKAGLDVRAAGPIVAATTEAFSSGFADLDRVLTGGFIRGSIATLEGLPSSGRTAILARALAGATRGGFAAVVDDGTLYPPGLHDAGVALGRLLLVEAPTPLAMARCTDILLRSRAFSVVTLPAVNLRGTFWSRLAALAQKSDALVLALGSHATTELAYFASTRVRCGIERVLWSDGDGILRELAGYEIATHVLKHRRGAPGGIAHLRVA